jgi:hypothetical protein
MDRKRQPSNYPVTPAAMSQSRFLNPASALLPQNVAHDRAMSEPVGPCRKCRCQEGAPASWRRSEAAIPELKGRRSVGPALVGCLHLPSGPFAPLLATTLVYAEKVRPQFLSLRQLGRSRVFSTRTCWQLPSSSSDFIFELRISNRQSRHILLRMAHFSPELWTLLIWYGSRNSNVSRGL